MDCVGPGLIIHCAAAGFKGNSYLRHRISVPLGVKVCKIFFSVCLNCHDYEQTRGMRSTKRRTWASFFKTGNAWAIDWKYRHVLICTLILWSNSYRNNPYKVSSDKCFALQYLFSECQRIYLGQLVFKYFI